MKKKALFYLIFNVIIVYIICYIWLSTYYLFYDFSLSHSSYKIKFAKPQFYSQGKEENLLLQNSSRSKLQQSVQTTRLMKLQQIDQLDLKITTSSSTISKTKSIATISIAPPHFYSQGKEENLLLQNSSRSKLQLWRQYLSGT